MDVGALEHKSTGEVYISLAISTCNMPGLRQQAEQPAAAVFFQAIFDESLKDPTLFLVTGLEIHKLLLRRIWEARRDIFQRAPKKRIAWAQYFGCCTFSASLIFFFFSVDENVRLPSEESC